VVGSPSQNASAINILKAIQDAFDMACQESRAARVVSIDRRGTRNKLAVQIISAAIEGGERDPVQLKAYALEEILPKAIALRGLVCATETGSRAMPYGCTGHDF
jgi:hypothetical protein